MHKWNVSPLRNFPNLVSYGFIFPKIRNFGKLSSKIKNFKVSRKPLFTNIQMKNRDICNVKNSTDNVHVRAEYWSSQLLHIENFLYIFCHSYIRLRSVYFSIIRPRSVPLNLVKSSFSHRRCYLAWFLTQKKGSII